MDGKIRLNKYLSESGFCSRREADRMIGEGKVRVDGKTAVLGQMVSGHEIILIDGKKMLREPSRRLVLAVNKPRGVVCTSDRRWGDLLLEDLVSCGTRVFSIGRLDKESEGLILMTNDGELSNRLSRARFHHEKEYMVTVDRDLLSDDLRSMSKGVFLKDLGKTTRPCQIQRTGKKTFSIILTEGLNRQIRRMCQVYGYEVRSLKRIRILGIRLGTLPAGQWRELNPEELQELDHACGLGSDRMKQHEN